MKNCDHCFKDVIYQSFVLININEGIIDLCKSCSNEYLISFNTQLSTESIFNKGTY